MNKEDITKEILDIEHGRPKTEDLSSYSDLEIKQKRFGNYYRIDDLNSLHSWLEFSLPEIQKTNRMIFRGHSEASYRLFNKAQRSFKTNEPNLEKREKAYHSLISEMLENARQVNDQILSKYFQSFGVDGNDIAILSFLQHYGAPTPIMDWTTDVYVALFFATLKLTMDDIDNYNQKSENEVNDYFSLYLLAEQSTMNTISDFKPLSIHTKTSATYSTLRKKRVAYIIEQFKSGKPKFLLQNNFHIISQKGIFVYNNSSNLPLEEIFMKHSFMYYLHYKSLGKKVIRTPLSCLDIHKSLAIYVKLKLEDLGYTQSTIFPKGEDIATMSTPYGLSGK